MPGLTEYSMRQMFWVSYAYTWCNTLTPETIEDLILTDVHAPEKCRTNQVRSFHTNIHVQFTYITGASRSSRLRTRLALSYRT